MPSGKAAEYSKYALNIGAGCVHGCKYCYAPIFTKKDKGKFHSEFNVKKDLLKKVESDLKVMKEENIKDPVLLCFINDPYQDEAVSKITGDCISLFKEYGRTFQILTKGGMRAVKHFDMYKNGDRFATTLTFDNDEFSRQIEPLAALPKDRIKALRSAKRAGISTWVSFEPALNEKHIKSLFMKTKDFVDLYKVGMVSSYKSEITDWKVFTNNMISLFDKYGKSYYIKSELRHHLV